ncbi:protein suppressor of hairy wing-like [Belonocnema kinseyi]|uniref:protein suppressor of hairy wing-like n=1 Tax=Belonocnema kinseyi TaxID=2817044 RepID=UPI00143D5415|nr:protein suppressor of hairy wing-like [Belonocnema kinseyi]
MMSLVCCAATCLSNHTTKVDGRSIKFYPFPNDAKLKQQWRNNCKSIRANNVKHKELFRLCELHFEKSNFTPNMQLKPKAVPTLFDFAKKRKREKISPIANKNAKRFKLENNDNNNDKNEEMFTSQSENIFTSTPLSTKAGLEKPSSLQPQRLGNLFSPGAKPTEKVYHGSYRLIIQIDKIRSKPGPKSKKLLLSSRLKKKSKDIDMALEKCAAALQASFNDSIQDDLRVPDQDRFAESDDSIIELDPSSPEKTGTNLQESDQNDLGNSGHKKVNESSENTITKSSQSNLDESSKNHLKNPSQNRPINTQIRPVQQQFGQSILKTDVIQQLEKLIKPPAMLSVCKAGCELQNVIFNSSPAFRCGKCNNIYIPQPMNAVNNTESQPIGPPISENLVCDICDGVFEIKIEYEKHMRLHNYMNPSTPFQCHLCNSVFDTKQNARNHISQAHGIGTDRKKQRSLPKTAADIRCELCNLIFKDEEYFRNHMKSHTENNKPAPPVGQVKSVRYACSVCSMEFSTLPEIEVHMKTHIETDLEELRCNICSKIFPNDQILRDHLRDHVARAHRCHLCPKAFVNMINLRVHLKNHA